MSAHLTLAILQWVENGVWATGPVVARAGVLRLCSVQIAFHLVTVRGHDQTASVFAWRAIGSTSISIHLGLTDSDTDVEASTRCFGVEAEAQPGGEGDADAVAFGNTIRAYVLIGN
jgi:hypothetical protein